MGDHLRNIKFQYKTNMEVDVIGNGDPFPILARRSLPRVLEAREKCFSLTRGVVALNGFSHHT